MSKINAIQQAIIQLDGGEYQKLMDTYLFKKFKYTNIEPLGSHTGTNKVTRGIPDSYVKLENGKYILIMYGTVERTSYKKIEKDIKSCFDKNRLSIGKDKIEEIICCYTSTNIHIDQKEELSNMIKGVNIRLIGIGEVSHDLLIRYPPIALDHLNIAIDTEQIFEIDDFIDRYDKNKMNASINMELLHRESEKNSVFDKIEKNKVVLLYGKSGVGKTRLGLEIARLYREKHNANVLCIKNNGEMLYNDLKYYLSEEGEYLLFIDDANQTTQLEHILDYIITPPEGIKVKIIMTVRDYAKDRVRKLVYNKTIPKEVEIGILSNKAIKGILSNNLSIKNDRYLDQIAQISKGNARLAVLAGKIALKSGLLSIYNSVDIFKNYYGEIIEKEFLDKEKIIVAFIIALLGPFEYKSNETAMKILRKNGIDEDTFYKLSNNLNDSEVIDLYMNRAVKISDQSMGDYLLYYVLIEKKYIILADIIKELFKENRQKLIYSLNTIIGLFNNDECLKYIEDNVNDVWGTIECDKEEFEYIKMFYRMNEEKSLAYIKSKVDKLEKEDILIDRFDLKEGQNNNSIKSELIEVLGGFKCCTNYELMLELVVYYFDKKPCEIDDFYILLSNRLGYDKNSFDFQYTKELLNVEYLWKASKRGLNTNLTILLLNIIDEYIKFEFHRAESDSTRTVNLITINLCMCEGLEKLRKTMWGILGELYSYEEYKNIINNILLKYNPYLKNKEHIKPICIMDFKYIKDNILSHIISPDFVQCMLLKHFKDIAQRLNILEDNILGRYEENETFLIYNTLVRSYKISMHRDEEEQVRKENIYNMIKGFERNEFHRLFKLCNNMLSEKIDIYGMESGIRILFHILSNDSIKYIQSIEAYLECDTPFCGCISNNVYSIIKFVGIKEAKKIICKYEYKQKSKWIYEFLFCIPIEERTITYANLLRYTFEDEIKKEQILIPNIKLLERYKHIDKDIVLDLSSKLLTINLSQKYYIIEDFLKYNLEENMDSLLTIFKKDINILENLYLIVVEGYIDYKGNLFINLVKNDIKFLERYMYRFINIKDKSNQISKFEKLWEQENYDELIKIAVNTIIESNNDICLWLYEKDIEYIFRNSENTKSSISDRKIDWIKKYIKINYEKVDYLNLIFQVAILTLKNNIIDILLYFLDINKNIKIFKEIKLFPRWKSYSGSEVSLIEKEIDFLKKLIDSMKGIDYISHKSYLKEVISHKEKHKQEVLVKEYLQDIDLA